MHVAVDAIDDKLRGRSDINERNGDTDIMKAVNNILFIIPLP